MSKLKSIFKSLPIVYPSWRWLIEKYHRSEHYILKVERKRLMKEAENQISLLPEDKRESVLKEYRKTFSRYRFSFDEWYNMYDLYGASYDLLNQYLSRSLAQKYYRENLQAGERERFYNKPRFLKDFKDYIHRRWIAVDNEISDVETTSILDDLLRRTVIIKPQEGSLGIGISKIDGETLSDEERVKLIAKLKDGGYLVEECIEGLSDIQAFHPQSLNTIRVVTENSTGKPNVFGSFIRFGRGGNVVDNAHAGGIFAHIDITQGIVDSDGIDTNGHVYTKHPDSNLNFKGFRIPLWDKITETCCNAHHNTSLMMVGWDVVVDKAGNIEIIEGNHAPDVDVMQSTVKIGLREHFEQIVSDYQKYHKR